MRLLVFDHFFAQDIDALARSAPRDARLQVISYAPLRELAQRYFPAEVFRGLEAWGRPEHAAAREAFAAAAERALRALHAELGFQALVTPSDSFFYLRPWIAQARGLGIPTLVVQKETTISPHTMDAHARRVRATVPFASDRMFVCSERHRAFWLRAGAAPARVVVTGQPRFDYYARPDWWDADTDPRPGGRRRVLFFSYDLRAYAPESGGAPPWATLRRETEAVLLDGAREGRWELWLKPHPQQAADPGARAGWAARAGGAWGRGVTVLAGDRDVRPLIRAADTVVGFQTTALFEALVAQRQVVYTHWTPEVARHRDALIPFERAGDVLHVARSPRELAARLDRGDPELRDAARQLRRRALFQAHLGPLDGDASERVWGHLARAVAAASPARDAAARVA